MPVPKVSIIGDGANARERVVVLRGGARGKGRGVGSGVGEAGVEDMLRIGAVAVGNPAKGRDGVAKVGRRSGTAADTPNNRKGRNG